MENGSGTVASTQDYTQHFVIRHMKAVEHRREQANWESVSYSPFCCSRRARAKRKQADMLLATLAPRNISVSVTRT